MIISAFERNSQFVTFDILTHEQLIILKNQNSIENNSNSLTEFDKINYPLVLSYEEISDAKSLKKIIDNLNAKKEDKTDIRILDNSNKNEFEDIISENRELKLKIKEFQKGLQNTDDKKNNYFDEKLGAVERERLYSEIELLKEEKLNMINEQKKEIIMLCSKIEKMTTENEINKKKIINIMKEKEKKYFGSDSNQKILEEKNNEISKLKAKLNLSKQNELNLKKKVNNLEDQLKTNFNKLKIQNKNQKTTEFKISNRIPRNSFYSNSVVSKNSTKLKKSIVSKNSIISKNSIKSKIKNSHKYKPPLKKFPTKINKKLSKNFITYNILRNSQNSMKSDKITLRSRSHSKNSKGAQLLNRSQNSFNKRKKYESPYKLENFDDKHSIISNSSKNSKQLSFKFNKMKSSVAPQKLNSSIDKRVNKLISLKQPRIEKFKVNKIKQSPNLKNQKTKIKSLRENNIKKMDKYNQRLEKLNQLCNLENKISN